MNTEDIIQKIKKIEERNIKVETNKAWETSITRKFALILITYVVVGVTLWTMDNPAPWTNAIIPSIGFFLSTLTLGFIKAYWFKHIYKR